MSLTETNHFQSSREWIAKRLGLGTKVVDSAIKRLVKLKLIKEDKENSIIESSGNQLEITSDTALPALKKACRQNLELATKKLEQTDFEERDFTAITLCFDPEYMDEAKKMIKKFRRDFCQTMESKEKKEVYKLSIQLFPLTEKRSKK